MPGQGTKIPHAKEQLRLRATTRVHASQLRPVNQVNKYKFKKGKKPLPPHPPKEGGYGRYTVSRLWDKTNIFCSV